MTDEKEQLMRITIPVVGMTCVSCVRRVERVLSEEEGVAEASVNFAAEKASVTYEVLLKGVEGNLEAGQR